MNSSGLNINLIESYFEILKNLSSENKIKLIEKLSLSIKNPLPPLKSKSIKSSYGAFVSEKSAEELIEEIKSARTSNRNKEEF
jgi:hypothetical protein